ncbi:hypothetical protein [Acidipila sp. EB88]|uniref:hypothetical protein n=1 Tax=Acidipila sp. EB88 TaxID=2305226 RepID=UPI0011CF03CE|nr:hypothetical protein [Acidipila sp. EB88]
MDLFLPVRKQMELIKAHGFPATWLLQFDAVVEGPFLAYLQQEIPASHEIGLWLENNRKLCDAAGIAWRGKPDWEWDYHVPVAYSIGYQPDDRKRLADAAMGGFRKAVGYYPKAVASWNLDAVTVAHLAEHYAVEALGNCRDQLATDGFTIWGSPITAYYPSRINAWSCALRAENQIPVQIFRLLGQDPVYYYDKVFAYPDTMEPVWPSGRSAAFVDSFYEMMAHAPAGRLAYAQLGQENSFGWPEMQEAYGMQLDKLAETVRTSSVVVEPMSATGRHFRRQFAQTPVQMQIMLADPYGKKELPERTIWYQSRFYRANLHFRGDDVYLRDLFVYSDRFPQIYLHDTATQHGIDQIGLAVLDGYHWSRKPGDVDKRDGAAQGVFTLSDGAGRALVLRFAGEPSAHEAEDTLHVQVPLEHGVMATFTFSEQRLVMLFSGVQENQVAGMRLCWEQARSSFVGVEGTSLRYRYRDFHYAVEVERGTARPTDDGVLLAAGDGVLQLRLAQPE